MKKIIMLLFSVIMTAAAYAQSDYTYLDAVKALTETGSLKTLGEKGYTLKKEARGTTHELFYTKGNMYFGDDFEWHARQCEFSCPRYLSEQHNEEHRHYLYILNEYLYIG